MRQKYHQTRSQLGLGHDRDCAFFVVCAQLSQSVAGLEGKGGASRCQVTSAFLGPTDKKYSPFDLIDIIRVILRESL